MSGGTEALHWKDKRMNLPAEHSQGGTVLSIKLLRDEAEERYTHADLAGMAHLLEQAVATTSAARSIAERRRAAHPVSGDGINHLQREALEQIEQSAAAAAEATDQALRDVVAATTLLRRRYRLQGSHRASR